MLTALEIGPPFKQSQSECQENKVQWTYTSLHETTGLVVNAMLTKVIAMYDPVSKQILSSVSPM